MNPTLDSGNADVSDWKADFFDATLQMFPAAIRPAFIPFPRMMRGRPSVWVKRAVEMRRSDDVAVHQHHHAHYRPVSQRGRAAAREARDLRVLRHLWRHRTARSAEDGVRGAERKDAADRERERHAAGHQQHLRHAGPSGEALL